MRRWYARNACARNASSRRVPCQAPAAINANDITAVILARNEARNLGRVIGSLPAGTRLLVVDSESTDATAAVARNHGARVERHQFRDFLSQRRFALAQVETPWTLMIDADEALDEPLRRAIRNAGSDADAYLLERTTFYREKALRMWRGESLVRLFRTQSVHLQAGPAAGGSAQLHERWVCNGRVGRLDGTLLHYSYPTHAAYAEKFARYTAVESKGVMPSGARLAGEAACIVPRLAWYALARGAALDGLDGIRVAFCSAAYPAVVQWKALRRRAAGE